MTPRIPFKHISGLPAESSRQIWRNFEEISSKVSPSPVLLIVSSGSALGKNVPDADLVCNGTTDSADVQALMDAHPGAAVVFSDGVFNFTGTMYFNDMGPIFGVGSTGPGTIFQWLNGGTYETNFSGGPILVGVGGKKNGLNFDGVTFFDISFGYFDVSSTGCVFSLDGRNGNTSCGALRATRCDFEGVKYIFDTNAADGSNSIIPSRIFMADCQATHMLTGKAFSRTTAVNAKITNWSGDSLNSTQFFNSYLTNCHPIGYTDFVSIPGTNRVLDDTNIVTTATALGGALTGNLPNPNLAGRDSSVDQINKDMLPAELSGPQSGITQFPPATGGGGGAPSGPAGGSLAGTYPNPSFAGRDSSVDQINKDLLPAVLLDQGMPMPQAFPPASYVLQDVVWVNVKDHGAVGDGVTDDTAAINAAITFANWPGKKAVIYFPPGVYLISSTITLSGGGASSTPQLALVGWGATVITTSVITMFTITNTISSVTRIHFQGLLIEPNATGAIGVSLKNAEFVTFNDCEFLGSGGTAISIVASSTSPYCGVYDCNFSNLASGIVFNGNADFFTISNCNFAEGLAGTGITGWIDVPVSTGSSNGVRITGCVFRGLAATQPVIQLKFAVNWTITGCAFFDSPQESILLGTNGSCKNTAITGCTFQKGLQNDITINGGRLNTITGCLFGTRGAGVAASTFVNVRIKNTFGGAAGADNVVTGCTSEDTGTALLGFAQLDDGCVNCSFLGNFYSIKIVQGHAQPVIIDPTLVQLHQPDEIDGLIGQPLGVSVFPPIAAGSSTPTGPAGGSLAGTYPNPSFAGRDSSVDALNKDMLPSELGAPQSGVTQFPPSVAPTTLPPNGPAGGSLAGTYPNPTFAGRDSSVDAINKDLLPSLLAGVSSPQGPTAFPSIDHLPLITTPGTVGFGTLIPQITVDATGRVTSASNVAPNPDLWRPDFAQAFLLMGA